jgi:hypothetical protein
MLQDPAAPTVQDDTLNLMNQIMLTCYSLDVSQYIRILAIMAFKGKCEYIDFLLQQNICTLVSLLSSSLAGRYRPRFVPVS